MFVLKYLGNGLFVLVRTGLAAPSAGLISLVVGGFLAWGILMNAIQLDIIPKYGFGLYVHNIFWAHQGESLEVKKQAFLFPEKTSPLTAEKGVGAMASVMPGQYLLVRGHQAGDGHTWIAVEAHRGNEKISAWMYMPCQSNSRFGSIGHFNECWTTEVNFESRRGQLIADVIDQKMAEAGISSWSASTAIEKERLQESSIQSGNPVVEVDPWRPVGRIGEDRPNFIHKKHKEAFKTIVQDANRMGDRLAFSLS